MPAEHGQRDGHAIVSTSPRDTERSGKVLDFVRAHIEKHGEAPSTRFYLSGTDVNDRVELSEELFSALKVAAEELSRGRSISILAREQEITTQQAADLLGLSRPTVVKLIDAGEIPAHVPGKVRRKLRLSDVLDYKDRLYERRTEFIADTSEELQHFEDQPERVAELLKESYRAR